MNRIIFCLRFLRDNKEFAYNTFLPSFCQLSKIEMDERGIIDTVQSRPRWQPLKKFKLDGLYQLFCSQEAKKAQKMPLLGVLRFVENLLLQMRILIQESNGIEGLVKLDIRISESQIELSIQTVHIFFFSLLITLFDDQIPSNFFPRNK